MNKPNFIEKSLPKRVRKIVQECITEWEKTNGVALTTVAREELISRVIARYNKGGISIAIDEDEKT